MIFRVHDEVHLRLARIRRPLKLSPTISSFTKKFIFLIENVRLQKQN